MKTGICPQCKSTQVSKYTTYGPMPRCASCLGLNRQIRYDRLNSRHRLSRSQQPKTRETICKECGKPYQRHVKVGVGFLCEGCVSKREDKWKQTRLDSRRQRNIDNPQLAKRKSLIQNLRKMGVTTEWYDAQPKVCGICGTEVPGQSRWLIDHDHSCCPPKRSCGKCVRGLLCSNCNTGLGMFKDSICSLSNAIKWVDAWRLRK